jgi:glycosyltransferase involved in cell wall biosynthesis
VSAARALRPLAGTAVRLRTRRWPPHSRLFAVGDGGGWSIDDDATRLAETARRLGYETGPPAWAASARRQSAFLPSHFGALRPRWLGSTHRLGCAYFHGRPGTPGAPEFDEVLERLRAHAARLDRVQVTHAEMHELVVAAGVDEARVFRIPIGVDIERFPPGGEAARAAAREALGLPPGAFVVGSFQKDGVGWGDGLEPKLVKGPDVLVEALAGLRAHAPDLVVLVTGPARGYVLRELARRGVRAVHVQLAGRDELAAAYHALDAYLVSSRQAGGPKSALEALATGTPLVCTRVGQAAEILDDGRDALLADVGDTEALAGLLGRIHDDTALAGSLREEGRRTAEAYAYPRLDERWAALLDGFVERG